MGKEVKARFGEHNPVEWWGQLDFGPQNARKVGFLFLFSFLMRPTWAEKPMKGG